MHDKKRLWPDLEYALWLVFIGWTSSLDLERGLICGHSVPGDEPLFLGELAQNVLGGEWGFPWSPEETPHLSLRAQ